MPQFHTLKRHDTKFFKMLQQAADDLWEWRPCSLIIIPTDIVLIDP